MAPVDFADIGNLEAQLLRLSKENPSALDQLEKQVKDYRIELARKDPSEFVAYVMKDEETQEPLRLAPYHKMLQDAVSSHSHVCIWGHNELGKELALTEEIPTPAGFTTMGALKVGDEVFAMDGTVTRVTAVSTVRVPTRTYKITFRDGCSIEAGADHQWLAWTVDRLTKGKTPIVITTEEMLNRGLFIGDQSKRDYPAYKWRLPLAQPAQFREVDLPIPPYALGAWLGDGDSDRFTVTNHVSDTEITDLVAGDLGEAPRITADNRNDNVTRASFRNQNAVLRALGVLQERNKGHRKSRKHIPELYKTASVAQRTELLKGICDTDGTIGKDGTNHCELCFTNEVLANDCLELLRSLGEKPALHEGSIKGYDHSRFRVSWAASFNPFHLKRKADRFVPGKERPTDLKTRAIVSIEPSEPVPMKCIQVDHPTRTYLAGRHYTVTHNSQLISIGRVLWEIGRNPNIRICIIQAAEHLAESIVTTIKRYIEFSPEYHEVFPDVRRGDVWTTTTFNIERPLTIKDPTVIATGVHGNILGRRFDLIIVDDALTQDNTATDYMRDDVFKWLQSTPMSRLTRKARIWVLGNAWHNKDAMHRFARMSGWRAYKFPARHPVTGEPYWPERWSRERFVDWASTRTPWETARTLDCIPLSEEAGRFRRQWFMDAIARGRGLFGESRMCFGIGRMPNGCTTYTGVDLGISERMGTDVTVIFTIMVTNEGRIQLLAIDSGNWEADEICRRILMAHNLYKSFIYVESVFAQRWILQLLRKTAPNVPVFPFQTRGSGNTKTNKRHTIFGVESVAAELAQGLWDIPSSKSDGSIDPQVSAWIEGCLEYDPESHTSDFLMACWIALQGARKQTGIIGYVGSAEHDPWVALDTTPLTDEERQEQARQEKFLFNQKQAESFWSDITDELSLPQRTQDEVSRDLGLDLPFGHG